MGITRELVEFCASVKYENLSSEIVDRVKYHCLDFLGVASRGSLVAHQLTRWSWTTCIMNRLLTPKLLYSRQLWLPANSATAVGKDL